MKSTTHESAEGRLPVFASLGVRNYRHYFFGALVSNNGTWMQRIAQDWLVFELTGSGLAVGITMALQFAPPLLLVGVTGWVADRFDRRHLLFVTQSLLMAIGALIGILILSGVMTLPLMYLFAFLLGMVAAFDNPARQAFVSDLVARENASNAVALNAASCNSARMIGPAVAGIMIVAVGTGWVFLVNAATFLAMIVALLLIRRNELIPRVKAPGAARLADGFRYVRRRPDLMVTFAMVFGMNFPIFASTMAIEFGKDADGYGLLSSVLAIGSLTGALHPAACISSAHLTGTHELSSGRSRSKASTMAAPAATPPSKRRRPRRPDNRCSSSRRCSPPSSASPAGPHLRRLPPARPWRTRRAARRWCPP